MTLGMHKRARRLGRVQSTKRHLTQKQAIQAQIKLHATMLVCLAAILLGLLPVILYLVVAVLLSLAAALAAHFSVMGLVAAVKRTRLRWTS